MSFFASSELRGGCLKNELMFASFVIGLHCFFANSFFIKLNKLDIITKPEYEIAQWISEQIDIPFFIEPYKTLASLDSNGIKAAVLYNCFNKDNHNPYVDCQMHVAARPNTVWATKEFLYHAFNYPFNVMECVRVTGLVRDDNERAFNFNQRLGFKIEGRLRKAQDGHDLWLMGMLKTECKWI